MKPQIPKCNRCDGSFKNNYEMVIDRPLLFPLKIFTKYYHAQCFNYNRYGILPKNYPNLTEQQNPKGVEYE